MPRVGTLYRTFPLDGELHCAFCATRLVWKKQVALQVTGVSLVRVERLLEREHLLFSECDLWWVVMAAKRHVSAGVDHERTLCLSVVSW